MDNDDAKMNLQEGTKLLSSLELTADRLIGISEADGRAIAEILERRANDIANFKWDLEKKTGQRFDELPGSVEMALSREIKRLRRLAKIVSPPSAQDDEDEVN